MEMVTGFIYDWRYVIIALVMIGLLAGLQWQRAKGLLYKLMLEAQKIAQNELEMHGKDKMLYVLEKAYARLPLGVKFFIKEDKLEDIVQELYETAQDILDDGKLNQSFVDETIEE